MTGIVILVFGDLIQTTVKERVSMYVMMAGVGNAWERNTEKQTLKETI